MAKNLLWKFTVNGTDVTSYVLKDTVIETKKTNINGNNADIFLAPTITNSIMPIIGQKLEISRGVNSSTEFYKFRGYITKIQNDNKRIRLM